jgi:hypothetical protein
MSNVGLTPPRVESLAIVSVKYGKVSDSRQGDDLDSPDFELIRSG